ILCVRVATGRHGRLSASRRKSPEFLWRCDGRRAVQYGERERPEHKSIGLSIYAQVAHAPRTVPPDAHHTVKGIPGISGAMRSVAHAGRLRRGHTKSIERLLQFIRDLFGAAALDLVSLHHVNQRAALQERDGW